MKRFRWSALLLFSGFAAALAPEQLKLFAGYSYLRATVGYAQVGTCPVGCPRRSG